MGSFRPTLRVVHILSEDRSFGISLTLALSRTFFVFKLKVGDEVLGDGAPAIEWTSVHALSRLRFVDDPRVDPDRNNAHAILDLLTSEDEPELYDRTLVQFGEAMDRYLCRGYLWGEEAVFLFWQVGTAADQVLMARLDAGELAAIASAAAAAHAALDSTR